MGRRIAVLAIMVAAFALAGCFGVGNGGVGPIVGGNVNPVAAFLYTQDGFDFTFSAAQSVDPDGTIDTSMCNWYFGDGGTSGGLVVVHTYAQPGTYRVRLVVRDNEGASGETTRSVVVDVPDYPPAASFTWTQGKAVGEVVSFNGKKSSDRDGEIVSGRWNFGDGRSTSGAWVRYSGGERFSVKREVTHVYRRAGNYTVTLTVTDDTGKTDSTSHTIVIREP